MKLETSALSSGAKFILISRTV